VSVASIQSQYRDQSPAPPAQNHSVVSAVDDEFEVSPMDLPAVPPRLGRVDHARPLIESSRFSFESRGASPINARRSPDSGLERAQESGMYA
jgi:hypothetical protein